jgi:hypothetical protein
MPGDLRLNDHWIIVKPQEGTITGRWSHMEFEWVIS